MATLKEELNSLFEIAGVSDAESARTIFSQWHDAAGRAETWHAHEQALFQMFGVDNHDALISAINETTTGAATANGHLQAIYGALGAADQPSAIAAIQTNAAQLTDAQNKIGELEKAQSDFDGRVAQEVINRAASAGIPEPVKKPAGGGGAGAQNIMTRAEFNALPPGERQKFIRARGKLTD